MKFIQFVFTISLALTICFSSTSCKEECDFDITDRDIYSIDILTGSVDRFIVRTSFEITEELKDELDDLPAIDKASITWVEDDFGVDEKYIILTLDNEFSHKEALCQCASVLDNY